MNSWIKLHSGFTEWEWYKDNNTKSLFIHCLLKANWKNGNFRGEEILRGSFVTSLEHLSKELGLTIRQTRTALEHLISTGEVTSKSTNKYRIITIVKYNLYQEMTNNLASKRQTNDKQDGSQPTTIEDICKYLCSSLERIYARTITSTEYQKVESLAQTYLLELIEYAIDISIINNHKSLGYVEGILKNWKNAGYKIKQDVLDNEKKVEEERSKPVEELFDYNWLDEE